MSTMKLGPLKAETICKDNNDNNNNNNNNNNVYMKSAVNIEAQVD
jgi:hypothetical protein